MTNYVMLVEVVVAAKNPQLAKEQLDYAFGSREAIMDFRVVGKASEFPRGVIAAGDELPWKITERE